MSAQTGIQWRVDLFDLIRRTPNLDWLLLTKRIGKKLAGRLLDGIEHNGFPEAGL